MRIPSWVFLVLGALVAPSVSHAALTFEVYNDRAAFKARLGGVNAVRIVDFDDVDTSVTDPVSIGSARYRGTKGVVFVGGDGQTVSRTFGSAADYTPVSPPNMYAPGFQETYAYFDVGFQQATVAGVGVVFIDADDPANGPSSIKVRNGNGTVSFTAPTVSGGNGSHVFQGVVAVDTDTNLPTAFIFEAMIVSGSGSIGAPGSEGVALDDFEYATPVPLGVTGENCDNCIDDDGDYFTDRMDAECDAPADGGNLGFGDAGIAKAILKCHKASARGGVAYTSAFEKQMQGCIGAVLKCVQLKPNDAACLAKAQGTCAKSRGKIIGLADKLRAVLGKGCGTIPDEVTFDPRGFGWNAEVADCARYGVVLQHGADAGECLVRQHSCRAQQLVSRENARALELAKAGGLDVATEFTCIEPGADGNEAGLGDVTRGKAAAKCQQAIAKAGATLAKNHQKMTAKCLDLIVPSMQLQHDDSESSFKLMQKCWKILDPVWEPSNEPKSLAFKAKAAIMKGCKTLSPADLLAPEGLGQSALAAQCQAIGVATFESAGDVADCMAAFHRCRAETLLEKQYPRSIEYEWYID